jgi:hypothetical protein
LITLLKGSQLPAIDKNIGPPPGSMGEAVQAQMEMKEGEKVRRLFQPATRNNWSRLGGKSTFSGENECGGIFRGNLMKILL